jgi:transcriptional regulator with XRE-family HTH domain
MPFTEGQRGGPMYSSEELGAYRAAMGITSDALAQHLGTHRPAISRYESARPGTLPEATAMRLVNGILALARSRDRLMADGASRLERIRQRHAQYAADMEAWAASMPRVAEDER